MAWTDYDLGVIAAQRGDSEAARTHLEAAGDNPRALYLLGRLTAEHDPGAAGPLYERAAVSGNADAAYSLGVIKANEGDYPAALEWYRRSAELGDVDARRMVGLMYAIGQGVPVDNEAAVKHWRAAAAAGQEQAVVDLGTLFTHHDVDVAEAAYWFLQAEGDAADRELARLAAPLQELAATDDRARTMLGVLLAFRHGEPARGAELLTASADAGDPVAQRSLGFLVQHGKGLPADVDRAAVLYRAAAEGGDGIAAFNVGLLLGKAPEAVPWLRQAAESGIAEAYSVLGDRLSEQDLDDEALRCYLRAAEGGHTGGMYAAACWYRDGFGGPVDLVQALRWFLAMLGAGDGNGLHDARTVAAVLGADDIHEAGRLSGRLIEADLLARG